jgi:cytochrome c
MRLWTTDGAPLAVLEGHGTWVNFALRSMMAVSSPETIMALCGRGPAKGKPWPFSRGHADPIRGVKELTDDRILFWCLGGVLRLWSTGVPRLLSWRGMRAGSMARGSLRDGRILSWGEDSTLRLWSNDGSPGRVLEGHSSPVVGACELVDGRLISFDQLAQRR